MIDTITLESPFIDEETSKVLELKSIVKKAVNMQDNNIIYEFTNASLKGSYDSKISIQIRKEKWVKYPGNSTPVKIKTKPYLRVEASVHKLVFGTNCIGGVNDFRTSVYILIMFIEKSFNVKLPDPLDWVVRRIDYAKNYYMHKDDKKEYFKALNLITYPRRETNRYGTSGILLSGTSTSIKVYDKYKDYLKHDKKRLKKVALEQIYETDKNKILEFIKYLDVQTENIIRFEVEIKYKKFKYDFNKHNEDVKVKEVTQAYIENIFINEVNKLLQISKESRETYYKNNDVLSILKRKYSSRKANSLYSFWLQYQTMGKEFTIENYSKSTFYRLRKELRDNGISLTTSDVKIQETKVIEFRPCLSNDIKDNSKYVEGKILKFLNSLAI